MIKDLDIEIENINRQIQDVEQEYNTNNDYVSVIKKSALYSKYKEYESFSSL